MEELQRDPRWVFPLEHWKKATPSRSDDLSYEEELISRGKGVQFITRMASMLRLPSQTIFAASLFLHRFYTRHSLKRLHPYQIAASCVFLACKTEESPRKLKDVATITTKSALKSQKTRAEVEKEHAADVEQWIKVIPSREDELLQTLKFDFEETAPYDALKFLIMKFVPAEDKNELGTLATSFINDSCRTILCITLSMKELAVVALYWASRTADKQIPDFEGEKWYSFVMSENKIIQSVNEMAEMLALVRNGVVDGQVYEKIQ